MTDLIPMISTATLLLIVTLAVVAMAKEVKEEKWVRLFLGLATIPAVLTIFLAFVTIWLAAGLSQLLPQIQYLWTTAMLVLSLYPGYWLPRLLYRVLTRRDAA